MDLLETLGYPHPLKASRWRSLLCLTLGGMFRSVSPGGLHVALSGLEDRGLIMVREATSSDVAVSPVMARRQLQIREVEGREPRQTYVYELTGEGRRVPVSQAGRFRHLGVPPALPG